LLSNKLGWEAAESNVETFRADDRERQMRIRPGDCRLIGQINALKMKRPDKSAFMIYLAFELWLPERFLLRTQRSIKLELILPPSLSKRMVA
jgi:hypothetical protein